MKNPVVLICIVLLLAACALGQQTSSYTLSVKVPFDFVVRGDTLPAGNYTVEIPSMTPGPMMVRQKKGNKLEFIIQLPVTEKWNGEPQVKFQRLGDTYFLMEIADPRFGVERVQQGDRYDKAIKVASAQTVVIAGR